MSSNIYIPKTKYLKQVIRSIWQTNYQTNFKQEIIIPKGIVEIIFDLGGSAPIHGTIYTKHIQLPKCFINGFNTHPIQIYLPEHHFFFGVQFHPTAIKDFFKIPASEFSNLTIDLTLLSSSFDYLWHQLAEVKTFDDRVLIITKWLESKIIETQPRDALLNSFLENNNPHATIKELSETVFYSPRHVSRKISEHTGMNSEQFLLYRKYLHAVHLMHHTELSLTEIAYDSNFTDQSHFTKTFKTFAQITPKEYRQNKGVVPGHINKDVR